MNVPASKLKDRVAALSLLVLVVAVAGLLVVRPLWATYSVNRDLIRELEDNVARFESIATRQVALEQQLARLEQDTELDALTLQADSATLAAAALQERVKSAVQESGGSLTSTQILESRKIESLELVSVNVRMTGSTPAVQRTLYALETGRPALVTDNLLIVTRRTAVRLDNRRTMQQDFLDLRFQVSGFYQPVEGTS